MSTIQEVIPHRSGRPHALKLRLLRQADGRAPLWIELAVIGWLFWLYDVVNDSAPLRHALALRNAAAVLKLEQSLHLAPELTLNRWLATHHTLALIASYYYFLAHAVVTFGLLAWLWWRRPQLYRRLRTQLVIVNLIAFAIFWLYPLAPPRMLTSLGYIDVVARSHALISWHSGALVHNADQLAGMPSLHVAWAAWSGLALWRLHPRRAVAPLAIAYPLLTAAVVITTGNHYLLDVFAGATVTLTALVLQTGPSRAWRAARRADSHLTSQREANRG
jgi:diacylglycerol O-acyltransferase